MLTEQQCISLKPKHYDYFVSDGKTCLKGRLVLKISTTGTKDFYFRWIENKKQRTLKIGRFKLGSTYALGMTLKEARMQAIEYGNKLYNKADIFSSPDKQNAPKNFFDLLNNYLLMIKNKPSYVTTKNQFKNHVFIHERLCKKPCNEIEEDDILTIIDLILLKNKKRTANAVLSSIKSAFNIQLSQVIGKKRSGNRFNLIFNPAKNLKKNPEFENVKTNYFSLNDIKILFKLLTNNYANDRLVLIFFRLCFLLGGQRIIQTVRMRWSWVNLKEQKIIIPYQYTKTGPIKKQDLILFLSDLAMIELQRLKQLTGREIFLFPNCDEPSKHMNPDTGYQTLLRLKEKHYQLTGECVLKNLNQGTIRRTYKTLAEEKLKTDIIIRDKIQDHVCGIKNASSIHYDRSGYFDAIKEALTKWAELLKPYLYPN